MGDVSDAMARSKGKPAPLDTLEDRPIQVESGAGLSFDEADLAARDKPHVAPLNPLPLDVPQTPAPSPSPMASLASRGGMPATVLSRQYRQVRDGMRQRGRSRGVRVHAFASPTAHDARTPTLINIGTAFGELADPRVLLLEANLRGPTFHRFFQKPFTPGLVHLLRGTLTGLDEAIHPTRHDNLHVLPAGDCEFAESRALLSSQAMADLMMELRQRYDHVLIDTPPLTDGDEACLLASMADESLLIARMHKTAGDLIERSKTLLRDAGCPLAGVILSHG